MQATGLSGPAVPLTSVTSMKSAGRARGEQLHTILAPARGTHVPSADGGCPRLQASETRAPAQLTQPIWAPGPPHYAAAENAQERASGGGWSSASAPLLLPCSSHRRGYWPCCLTFQGQHTGPLQPPPPTPEVSSGLGSGPDPMASSSTSTRLASLWPLHTPVYPGGQPV